MPFSLGVLQETIWEFISTFSPEDPAAARYNLIRVRSLRGKLDKQALEAAYTDASSRHPSSRMFWVTQTPDPIVDIAETLTLNVNWHLFQGYNSADEGSVRELGELIDSEYYRYLDLRQAPLHALSVFQIGADEYVLTLVMSHIIIDGRGLDVFFEDIGTAYSARVRGTAPAWTPLEYESAYTRAALLQDTDLVRRHWRETLRSSTQARLQRPDDLAFFPVSMSAELPDLTEVAAMHFGLGSASQEGLTKLAYASRSSTFLVLSSLYALTLAAKKRANEVTLGTVMHGRHGHVEDRMAAQFTRNLYVRYPIALDVTLRDFLRAGRDATLAARRNSASHKLIAQEVIEDFDAARPWPFLYLYDAWFQGLEPTMLPSFGDLETSRAPSNIDETRPPRSHTRWEPVLGPAERLPLWLKRTSPDVMMSTTGDRGYVLFNPDLFASEMVQGLVDDFRKVVIAAVDEGGQELTLRALVSDLQAWA